MKDVKRFLDAQAGGEYEAALAEIRAGRKRSHWIWYVFPQVEGLGQSSMAEYYGIGSRAALDSFVGEPTLVGRLREITQALLDLPGDDPVAVLGGIDVLKVRSCMTLFADATGERVFSAVLDKYYDGRRDERTREIVAGWRG